MSRKTRTKRFTLYEDMTERMTRNTVAHMSMIQRRALKMHLEKQIARKDHSETSIERKLLDVVNGEMIG